MEHASPSLTFEPIGYLESCYRTKFGTPRQPAIAPASQAVLRLIPKSHLQGAFAGLEGFSHLWIIFYFHLNTNKVVRAKVHPPRLEGKKVGLFATRTPHRPNPIGLSVVKLERVERDTLYLSGIDLVNGTPILDVKPYLAEIDAIPTASAGWTAEVSRRELPVRFEVSAEIQLKELTRENESRIRALICQTLSADPRPQVYRDTTREAYPDLDVHAVYLEDLDVHFRVDNDGIEVVKILKV